MEGRLNVNVSAVDYDSAKTALGRSLSLLEERLHLKDGFAVTDSEFAFGWHFFVLSVDRSLIEGLAEQMGPDFEAIKGRGTDKKFLTWLQEQAGRGAPRFKLAVKEEMESSKFGIF